MLFFYNSFEAGNGLKFNQHGSQKEVEPGKSGTVAEGTFSYTDAEGNPVEVSYVADENGYQPKGNIIPTAPPLPPSVARQLEYIREHPQENEESPK